MKGRPQLFRSSKQISVLVSGEDFRLLTTLRDRTRIARPGYSYGDLVRGFIRRCLDEEDAGPSRKLNPAQDRIRRLHGIAQAATMLAHELDKKKPAA